MDDSLSGSTAYTFSDSATDCFHTHARGLQAPALLSHSFDYEREKLLPMPKATEEACWECIKSVFTDMEIPDMPDNPFHEATGQDISCNRLHHATETSRCEQFVPSQSNSQGNLDTPSPFRSLKSLTSSDCTDSLLSEDAFKEPTWLLEVSDVRGILGQRHPFLVVEPETVAGVIKCYQDQITPEGGNSGSPKSSSATADAANNTTKAARKRPFEADELVAGDSEGPTTKSRRKQTCPGEARLSCPFQKRDPERYPLCGIRYHGFLTIAHVKQHLRRSHKRNPNYCPRCKATFLTEAQKNDHIVQAFSVPCQERVAALPEGISPEMEEALTRRVEQGSNLHAQWFSVWDLTFPGIPRPASCTFDFSSETHIQVLGLTSYLESEGPRIVQSTLQSHGLFVWSASPEQLDWPPSDVETFTRGVLSQAFRQIYESWQGQRPQPGSANPPSDPSLQDGLNLPPTPIPSSNHSERVAHMEHVESRGLGVKAPSSAASVVMGEVDHDNGMNEPPSLSESDEAIVWLTYEDNDGSEH